MKQVGLLLVALVLLSLPAFAQTTTPVAGTWNVGVGAEGGLPVGDFNNISSFGIGGVAWAVYNVDENLGITGKAGYVHFGGKDITTGFGTVKTTYSIVPILVGARYFLMPPADMRVYGQAEAGLFLLSASADIPAITVGGITVGGGSTSSSESKFGFVPTLGAQFKAGDKMNVDVHANYTMVFSGYTFISTDVTNTTWVGVGIGLEFGL